MSLKAKTKNWLIVVSLKGGKQIGERKGKNNFDSTVYVLLCLLKLEVCDVLPIQNTNTIKVKIKY